MSAETEQLRSVLEHLPDDRLRLEVMTRLAESFFSCTNTHKFFVQLYGRQQRQDDADARPADDLSAVGAERRASGLHGRSTPLECTGRG